MCGIAGFIDHQNQSSKAILEKMAHTLQHRGPDDNGALFKATDSGQIGLGHQRLSIIDISEAGHQPMTYKQWTLVFNGEIYNYQAIKTELQQEGHNFFTQSDTEVILHAYEAWGMDCLEAFRGMFAFVLYDQQEQKLWCCRDRLGVKPFYYYSNDGLFLFASELKAFHQHPRFEKNINAAALNSYFDFGYIPAPMSIFKHTHKLNPGHWLMYDLNNQEQKINSYWSAATHYQEPKLSIPYAEAKVEVHKRLQEAFAYRMVADVPVGVFLSGGYDSTAVTSILQASQTEQLKTFTIGFEEGNNEAPYARATAAHLGTDHHELICTTPEAQEIIPQVPHFYDEPFADSSAIPTMLVSRFAREHVTVALSADGGDELFSGYQRYKKLQSYQSLLNSVPKAIKPLMARLALQLSHGVPDKWIHRRHHLEGLASSVQKDLARQQADLYKWMHWLPRKYLRKILRSGEIDYLAPIGAHFPLQDPREHPMLVDTLQYLPDDILTKVDRATMSVSLEGRDPLLDHHLIEYLAQLPYHYKQGQLGGKQLLKDIVHDYVPSKMMDRPKAGFSIPFTSWFRGDLKETLDHYFSEKKLEQSKWLNPSFVYQLHQQFKEGRLHYTPLIWKLLVFQMWWEEWME